VKAANDAVPSCSTLLPEQKSDSALGLDGLILAMSQLTEALIQQAEAISQLAMSNEALANAVASQPEEEEDSQGLSKYL
jgi:hypothetical protein